MRVEDVLAALVGPGGGDGPVVRLALFPALACLVAWPLMNLLVTAGNTLVPVDRVRCITNIFTGRTGTGGGAESGGVAGAASRAGTCGLADSGRTG